MTDSSASTPPTSAATRSAPVDMRRYYSAKPYAADPNDLIPADVPADAPLHTMSPSDVPAVWRESDFADPERPKLRYFSQGQYRTIRALAETLIAPPEGEERSITPSQIAVNVDRYVACSNSIMRLPIRFAMILLNLRPLFSFKPPFRKMSLAARRKFAKGFERNKGIIMPQLARLKSLIYLSYYGDPRVDAETQYENVLRRDPPIFQASRRHFRDIIWNRPDPLQAENQQPPTEAQSEGT